MEKLRILIAEDEVINQKIAKKILTITGHEIDIVSNGLEAVELYMKKPYDIIFMDIQMPLLDGLQATRRIRRFEHAISKWKHAKIIALTTLDNRPECMAAGMDDHTRKPFHANEFIRLFTKFGLSSKSTGSSEYHSKLPAS